MSDLIPTPVLLAILQNKINNGKDGTSVTVSDVSESSEDGGDNVVTFSDGKSVTIKNGKKGSPGTPGKDGNDGATPFIGENGNWWIGETDTGVSASGGSGGSGGSVESEEWELINTITVNDDETNSVIISADASGNEFSLKKIYVYATGVEPMKTYFTFKINGLPWQEQFATDSLQPNNLSSNNPLRFLWEKINDRVYRYISNSGVGIRAVGEITTSNGTQSNIETVNSIGMAWGTNVYITNGAVFQLWGIRA